MITLLVAASVFAQAQTSDWFAQNTGVIIAFIAILGTVTQMYMGTRQKKVPTGEAQLEDERAYRADLRKENIELRAEKDKLEDEKDAQRAKIREFDTQIDKLRDEKDKTAALVQELSTKLAEKDAIIKENNATMSRLNKELNALKNGNGNGH